MKRALPGIALALLIFAIPACTPERAMDFGPDQEVTGPPDDQLSAEIMRDFDGKQFVLGHNDREAEVRLAGWPPERHVLIPFWLGVNPLYPNFLRPHVGRIYVISEAVLVRPLGNSEYLIRAGSTMFKSDTLFETRHTRYADSGKLLPMVVRFVGTRVITVPKDAPETGTVTEKVPVLREVSLPMQTEEKLPGYARFELQSRT
jgi:hypothetical protein